MRALRACVALGLMSLACGKFLGLDEETPGSVIAPPDAGVVDAPGTVDAGDGFVILPADLCQGANAFCEDFEKRTSLTAKGRWDEQIVENGGLAVDDKWSSSPLHSLLASVGKTAMLRKDLPSGAAVHLEWTMRTPVSFPTPVNIVSVNLMALDGATRLAVVAVQASKDDWQLIARAELSAAIPLSLPSPSEASTRFVLDLGFGGKSTVLTITSGTKGPSVYTVDAPLPNEKGGSARLLLGVESSTGQASVNYDDVVFSVTE